MCMYSNLQFNFLRYPVELEKAIEGHLASFRGMQDAADVEADMVAEGSLWTMDLVSLALAGVKSQVQYQHPLYRGQSSVWNRS